jgi:hypothetical protein
MEVCMDAFTVFLKQFAYVNSVPLSVRQKLHASLLAIMGNTMGYGSRQWFINSEALSLEILRQASLVADQSASFTHETLSSANDHLLHMFYNSHTRLAAREDPTSPCLGLYRPKHQLHCYGTF